LLIPQTRSIPGFPALSRVFPKTPFLNPVVRNDIEDAYRYAIKNEGSSWAEQLRLLWENIFNTLLLQGISRIEGENTLFDLRVHSAVQVKEDKRYKNGLVLEVLRCGYTYKSRLLRKAQVVVNKIDRGEHAEQ